MKHDEQALHAAAVNTVAALMAAAAKTAPKSCGADTLETVVLDGADMATGISPGFGADLRA